jgi:hypothetical protein
MVRDVIQGMAGDGQYGEGRTSKGEDGAVLQGVRDALEGAVGRAVDGAVVAFRQLECPSGMIKMVVRDEHPREA